MEVSIIVALISAALALITSAVSVASSMHQRYRSNITTIVTQGRIKNLDGMRAGHKKLSALLDRSVILAAKDTNYPHAVREAEAELRIYLKPFYEIETKILTAIDETAALCIRQFEQPDADLGEQIAAGKARYEKLYAQYDWVFWKYLQLHTKEKLRNNDLFFDGLYEQTAQAITTDYPDYRWEN